MTTPDVPFGRLAEFGQRMDAEVNATTRRLFSGPVASLSWMESDLVGDVDYGPHERHKLDIAPAKEHMSPIVLFVHGGGFVAGDKNSDGLFYTNVPRYFAHHGFMGVAMNYRYAGAAPWPGGAEDVSSAVLWLQANARAWGGDPNRIVLLAQSAGACHIATYLFDPHFAERRQASVRAAALMSGYYVPTLPLFDGARQYFGEDARLYASRSSTAHVTPGHIPILLTVAQYDPGPIVRQTLTLARALLDADEFLSPLLYLHGHNHISPAHALGLGDDKVGRALRLHFEAAVHATEPLAVR